MKENSREEDIKMIEILKNKNLYINIKPKSSICIDCINKNKNKHIEAEVVINEKLEEAINYILSDYKRVLKENEELKNDYENLSNSVVVKNHCIKNSIPIQKVKDKIEELKQEKKKYGNCLIEMYEDELVNRDIKILQELLESEEK